MSEPKPVRFDEALPLERTFETLLRQAKTSLAALTMLQHAVEAYERKLQAEGKLPGWLSSSEGVAGILAGQGGSHAIRQQETTAEVLCDEG